MIDIKNRILLIIFALTVSCSGNNKQGQASLAKADSNEISETLPVAAPIKKYQIKSGIVTFFNEGMGMKTKTVLYFDDYGMKEAEEKYEEDAIKETTLCDGKYRYIIIHADKTAYESGECFRGVAYKFDWAEIERAPDQYKGKKMPNVSIAGKDCESFSIQSGKSPIVYAGWNNICLLIDQETSYGKITYKAVSIEENAAIPAGKLTIPEGYAVKKSPM